MADRTSGLVTPAFDVNTMSAVSPARAGNLDCKSSKAAIESECPPLKLSLNALPTAPPTTFNTTNPTIQSTTTVRLRR